ncbi:hypothetical protein C8R44DRAFT_985685 [Mycena epipterygia]|nr:hypothetical protein C8R44DRAFT_985685 [Mycena epipterygia]
MKATLGYDPFAYMRFLRPTGRARNYRGALCSQIDSFLSLVYPAKIELWREHLCVDGRARAYIENNIISPLPWYMTPEEKEHLKKALLAGGLTAPLCWYRASLEEITAEDDARAFYPTGSAFWHLD